MSAFLISGLSAPDQDVLWVIDEDEIASNTSQLTHLTELFARVSSHYVGHNLRHLRCGTTRSDDGNLALEDLAAIADYAAGTLSEVCTAFVNQSRFPVRNLVTPAPTGLTWKSRLIASWMAYEDMPLCRHTCIFQLSPTSSGLRVTSFRWHGVPGQFWLP